MTETQGTITVNGFEFSTQLTTSAAEWLEQTAGQPIVEFMQNLLGRDGKRTFNSTKVGQLMTALYLAKHPGMDPEEAEAVVDQLTLADMLQVLVQAKPLQFEPKDSPPAE
jgi:hypothetical protein